MRKKIRLGVLFGGKSAEHEISIRSAKNIFDALDKEKYEVCLIGIDRNGRWHVVNEGKLTSGSKTTKQLESYSNTSGPLALTPGSDSGQLLNFAGDRLDNPIDVIFPVLHGPFGEDGSVQGMLKLANIPFVGSDILGSAVGMDKDVMKRLLRDSGLPIGKFLTFNHFSRSEIDFLKVKDELGLPVFVKPANLGSSVGISKANNKEQFERAVEEAFEYDTKIIIEENIVGREVECAVLGDMSEPIASVIGEVIARHDFYSYEAKYIDENGATLKIPADLPEEVAKRIRYLAVKAFQVLCCEGLSRVDFFVKSGGEIIVNEINTMPGFTNISMYPRLWEVSGLSYSELIDRLVHIAIAKFEREQKLRTTPSSLLQTPEFDSVKAVRQEVTEHI